MGDREPPRIGLIPPTTEGVVPSNGYCYVAANVFISLRNYLASKGTDIAFLQGNALHGLDQRLVGLQV
jgi:hypothetical protein